MFRPPVRAITLGVAEPHPLPARVVERAGSLLRHAAATYQDAGYQVQTVRLSTRPVFDDLADRPVGDLVKYAHGLQEVLDAAGLGFCSLGTALAGRPGLPLARVEAIADLLIGADALSATVQLATPQQAAPPTAGLAVAQVMRRLAAETDEGFGNFRFAALACVPPGTPFFPAAYHQGPTSLALGLQGAGIVAAALGASGGSPPALAIVTDRVRAALIQHATPIVGLGEQLAQQAGVRFAGIDLSPAPAGADRPAVGGRRRAGDAPGQATVGTAVPRRWHANRRPDHLHLPLPDQHLRQVVARSRRPHSSHHRGRAGTQACDGTTTSAAAHSGPALRALLGSASRWQARCRVRIASGIRDPAQRPRTGRPSQILACMIDEVPLERAWLLERCGPRGRLWVGLGRQVARCAPGRVRRTVLRAAA